MQNTSQKISLAVDDISLMDKLEHLPTSSGVYQFKNSEKKILYIGKAVNLRNRVRQYFHKSRSLEPRIVSMLAKTSDVEIITTDSEVEALILEANLVKHHKPRYNVNLKDDKSYPYIVITNEPYPRVFVTRKIYKNSSRYFGPYTDVSSVRAALKIVRDIFKIRSCNFFIDEEFIRKKKTRVCLDYHIKKCDGPCEGLISQERYTAMIENVAQVLQGKTQSVLSIIEKQMREAATALRFEEAATLRDQIRILEIYSQKQKVIDVALNDRDIIAIATEDDDACGIIFKIREGKLLGRQHYYLSNVEGKSEQEIIAALLQQYYVDVIDIPSKIILPIMLEEKNLLERWLSEKKENGVEFVTPTEGELQKLVSMGGKNARYLLDELKLQRMKQKEIIPNVVQSLQRDLRLKKPPRRIECFDISHFQGTETVASMVVFVDGKAKKSEYRKFKIETVAQGDVDDFASMREVIFRRYKRLKEEQKDFPDLIIVDGGKGQLSSAIESLQKLEIQNQPIISLAKQLEEVFVPNESEATILPKTSSSLKLLQQIRDEAHRFAVTFHRSLRDKRTLQTELDLIEGIGKKRAKELLEVFGSVQGVKFATDEQLQEVVGEKITAKIREYFG